MESIYKSDIDTAVLYRVMRRPSKTNISLIAHILPPNGHRSGVTPEPIPNSEAKPAHDMKYCCNSGNACCCLVLFQHSATALPCLRCDVQRPKQRSFWAAISACHGRTPAGPRKKGWKGNRHSRALAVGSLPEVHMHFRRLLSYPCCAHCACALGPLPALLLLQ